jgi:hypothetical protein
MYLTDEEAKEKICIQTLYGMADRPRESRMLSNAKCFGSDCIAYWRWENSTHVRGYCGCGGRPEE